MLCGRCQRFDIQAFGRDPYPYRGVPLLSVIRSSNHCSFCSLLLGHLQETNKDLSIQENINMCLREQKSSQILRWNTEIIVSLLAGNWVNFAATKATKQPVAGSDGLNVAFIDAFIGAIDIENPKSGGFARFHVAADPVTPASTSQDITGQILMDRPWSFTISIESIQTWHRECVSNHPKCCRTLSGTRSCQVENPRLPTRCIETVTVATRDGTSPWRHMLRETADQRGKYICLSHRWDTETNKSKTTPANYIRRIGKNLQQADHTQPCTPDIDWMPRLFAETCILAYSLGIKYVWIDSICITQDDEEEWNREAPQMAQYYQNAWVTVAAANEIKANGLLNMRRKEPVPRMTRLPYMDRNGEQKGYFYIQSAQPDVLQKDFSAGVEKSELLQRGWVFQEWRLSRRIIAFSASGFFLHCHTLGSMSSMGDHLNGAGVGLGQNSRLDGYIVQRRSFSPSVEWENIVTEYSRLGLTYFAKDRLMALAGVASEFGRIMEALKITSNFSDCILNDNVPARRYVCGLWLINIHRGLLWEQATQLSRERVPGIPTWSWASIAIPVKDKNNERVLMGMSVRWPEGDTFLSERQGICAIRKATTISVDEQNWVPQFSSRPVSDDVPKNEYGNENRFVVLTFHGSLIPVQIERLLSKEGADLANEMTSTAPDHPRGMGLWRGMRGICLPRDPDKIIGWASVEHPEFQSYEKIASSSGFMYALFLMRCEQKGGWFQWGGTLVSRVIFAVLLVRRVCIPGLDESFERVGVGRLFGEEVDRRYSSTEKTTISLV